MRAILDEILIPTDIASFAEDIRNTCFMFKEVSIGCCARDYNRAVDRVANSVHKQHM